MLDANELLCPTCSGLLQLQTPTLLSCPRCDNAYPVKGKVAVLLPAALARDVAATIETFSRKWQLAPTEMRQERRRIANPWFLDRFGFRDNTALSSFLKDRQRILDAGCGLGNLTELLASLAPHAVVYGVDLSSAVHYTQRAENIRLVQGDILALPVAGEFDLIVADGVLHHTADTRLAMQALFGKLEVGGDFLFYVYKRKAPVREFCDDHLRKQVAGMTEDEAVEFCAAIADLGRELADFHGTVAIKEPIPALGIQAGTYNLQRFIYWHFLKCFCDPDGPEITSVLENYDWYRPKYAWRHTQEEVRSWVAELPADLILLNEVKAGFAVQVHKRGSHAPSSNG